MENITQYREEYVFLDLAYPTPVYCHGKQYPSVLEGVQTLMKSYDERKDIDNEHRAWYMRYIMTHMLQWKFVCNKDLADKLMATGDAQLTRGHSEFNKLGNELMMEIRKNLQNSLYFLGVRVEDGERSSSVKKYYKSFEAAAKYLSTQNDYWSFAHCKPDDSHIIIYCCNDND